MSFDYHEYRNVRGSAYSLGLTQYMIDAFKKFADQYISGGRRGIKKGNIGLKNSQYTNFQRLRMFGLIQQYLKGSEWYLTDLGEKFYRGEVSIVSPCGHLWNQQLPDSHPAWQTFKGTRKSYYISDKFPSQFKQRQEYKAEKVGDTLFS